jgi:hypothetical protein
LALPVPVVADLTCALRAAGDQPMMEARAVPSFAHASEAELARILDFYAVAWEYEPHTFPILFDRSGAVLESFSPDFYLPELDLYVELTTLRQRLVRKKNRKLRRLRELYPGIRIKLLYARDFRALMFKYGRLGIAAALTGTEGQTTPPRSRTTAATAAPAAAAATPGPATAPTPRTGSSVAPGARDAAHRRVRRTRSEARARADARAATGDATEVSA